ncbi:MAG: DNA replication complex GINS family protein [Desulfurococcales archaeon]|nr:DNA replication complex GINS family protein [Desulfurococcales archaeon]
MIRGSIMLANIYHLLSPVRVAVLRDLGRVRTEGGWEVFSRGEEAFLPLWLAKELERKGFVEIRETPLTEVDMAKYLIVERSHPRGKFQSLKERFYLEARELYRKLKAKIEEKRMSAKDLLASIKVEADLQDIVNIRVSKIIQVALLGGKLEDFEEQLLLEEKVLFNCAKNLVDSWVREVLGDVRHGQ